ncbi:MAG: PIN domain-containing protein [Caulobacteraceae bacterium]
MRAAFDTNVLAYAEGVEQSEADTTKRRLAQRLLRSLTREEILLPRQALAELHFVLVRKAGLSPATASSRVQEWQGAGRVIDTDAAVFAGALELASRNAVPIFDAIILGAAAEGRCDLLLSEDFQEGFAWRGVAVANPFAASPNPRLRPLL